MHITPFHPSAGSGSLPRMSLSGFVGTERFEVLDVLGAGVAGEVFRVWDRRSRATVALKVLHNTGASGLFRFKREFRALAEIHHPNLVQLYELLSEGERWFFTMELVEGTDFLTYTRGGNGSPLPEGELPDVDRLRRVTRQLATGLAALHDAGKLHCDLKPSNIRVTPEGRPALLDFGLVRELRESPIHDSMEGTVSGTPAYMAPEVAAGETPTRASDWYAVGTMLYQALTGSLPFSGPLLRMIEQKDKGEVPPVRGRLTSPEAPEDLAGLCDDLLRRHSAERLCGTEVMRRLGKAAVPVRGSRAPFVGREEQLAALRDAWEDSRRGRASVVLVSGASGMGKSALLRAFLDEVGGQARSPVVLAGKCYERESVPFKALDALVDELGEHLLSLPDAKAEVLMPRHVRALVRLFPVLDRVGAVVRAGRHASRALDLPDRNEIHRRARAALRELLTRMVERRPTVLSIDDLQWGDEDSAGLLLELLRPPAPPPLLVLLSYRGAERHSPFVERLLAELDPEAAPAGAEPPVRLRHLEVGPLSEEEARAQARRLLGDADPSVDRLTGVIARESGGHPFFVSELAHYAAEELLHRHTHEDVAVTLTGATLDSLMERRLAQLSAPARRLIELVSVGGRPLDLAAVLRAADLGDDAWSTVAALRAAGWIQVHGGRAGEQIEPAHDRVAEAITETLEATVSQDHHLRLAHALEEGGRTDAETLAVLFRGAGERRREAELVMEAARHARDALAFGRAAELYREALDAGAVDEQVLPAGQHHALRFELAEALRNAGRCAAAADAYLAAADTVAGEVVPQDGAMTGLELRRRAVTQLLISGRIDRGLEVLRGVLDEVGLKYPETIRSTISSILFGRLRLKLRGLKFKKKAADEVAPEDLVRIDTCWSVAHGLGLVDTIRGMHFNTLNLLLALKAGEPYRIARALAIQVGYSAVPGSRRRERTAELAQLAQTLASEIDHPHALGLVKTTMGVAACLEGDWPRCLSLVDRGEELLRDKVRGARWELDLAVLYRLKGLTNHGRWRELFELLPGYLREVEELGNLHAETTLRSRFTWLAELAADRPAAAHAEIVKARSLWRHEGFHNQHLWQCGAEIEILVYERRAEDAWQRACELWPQVVQARLLKFQMMGSEARHQRSRAALALLASGADDAAARAAVEEDVQAMEAEKCEWLTGLALLLRAGLASVDGDRGRALEALEAGKVACRAADLDLYAAAAERRRGQLLGTNGEERVRSADEAFEAQGVRNPAAMTDLLLPGRW